jgi:hypothetical protein
MRKKILLLSTLLLLFSTPAWAAGPMPDTIKVTFPFPVVVGEITLPPGSYEFKRENNTMPAYFRIYNAEGKQLGLTTLANRQEVGSYSPSDVAQRDEVVVDEINGKYYLDTFYMQGEKRGFRFTQADVLKRDMQKASDTGRNQRIPVLTQGASR